MEILNDTTRKANKNHICDYCGYEIKKGDKYNHQTNKNEGEIYTWKSHLKCIELANYLDMFDNVSDEGLSRDAFVDIISDEFDEKFSLEEKINILYEKKVEKAGA